MAGLGRVVHRPHDHAATGGVNRIHQRLVHHLAMGPVVAGPGRAKGMHRIHEVRVHENADGQRRPDRTDIARNAVIETVDGGAHLRMPQQAGEHSILDVACLHLHVDCGAAVGGREDAVERGNSLAGIPDRYLGESRPIHRRDGQARQTSGGGWQDRVVMDHDDPISRFVDIELPSLGASDRGGKEPLQGILAVLTRQPTMGDQLRDGAGRHSGLGVGAVDETSGGSLNIARPPASAYQTVMPDLTLASDDTAIDVALITRWMEGDQRAASALVARHVGPLARFVSSLGVHVAPDELVQDTFVKAFGSLDTYRGDSSLRAWLFTIARRLVLDQRRATKRDRLHVAIEDVPELVSADDVLDGVVADESAGRVRAAVARLSPTQREVFTLRVIEGLSYREIATVASTTEGAARVHYHNAMRAVKEFLDA